MFSGVMYSFLSSSQQVRMKEEKEILEHFAGVVSNSVHKFVRLLVHSLTYMFSWLIFGGWTDWLVC